MVQYTYYHLGMIGTIANLLVDGNNDCDDFKHQKERFHRFFSYKEFYDPFYLCARINGAAAANHDATF